MTEENVKQELDRDPFLPLRLHLVSGKTIDVVRQGVAWPLENRLLVFLNPAREGTGAENYDVVAYHNIERIQILSVGKRPIAKRKPA